MTSHWTDDTGNWLEIFKRKLAVGHKDLYEYLDKTVKESSLTFIDLQACALSAIQSIGYPVFAFAIEKEMGVAVEAKAASIASSMAALNWSWMNYLQTVDSDVPFFNEMPDVLVPNGGTTELKFSMYLLSANVVYANQNEIGRLVTYLRNHISEQEIIDIVKIASVMHAAVKAQV